MAESDDAPEPVENLLQTPHLADALESESFRHFLDQIPFAIAVADLAGEERIIYANPEFERRSGQTAAEMENQPWTILRGVSEDEDPLRNLGDAVVRDTDRIGAFRIDRDRQTSSRLDVYSNVIVDENGTPAFRLVAMVDISVHNRPGDDDLTLRLKEKDTQLLEIQHRVKNNLQMITALIRLEARNAPRELGTEAFDRLAGRIDALQLLYQSMSEQEAASEVDLGVYLSQIASGVMRSYAVEGIRLDLKVDTYPASLNVAMPTGLVVNELLTNALKHAFVGREGGVITLHSLADATGCRVTVADDGIGLPEGVVWPSRGKLAALIVQSLVTNAKAKLDVVSQPGQGMRVTITFARAEAAPKPAS